MLLAVLLFNAGLFSNVTEGQKPYAPVFYLRFQRLGKLPPTFRLHRDDQLDLKALA